MTKSNELSLGPNPSSWVDSIASAYPGFTQSEYEKIAVVIHDRIDQGLRARKVTALLQIGPSGNIVDLEIIDVGKLLKSDEG